MERSCCTCSTLCLESSLSPPRHILHNGFCGHSTLSQPCSWGSSGPSANLLQRINTGCLLLLHKEKLGLCPATISRYVIKYTVDRSSKSQKGFSHLVTNVCPRRRNMKSVVLKSWSMFMKWIGHDQRLIWVGGWVPAPAALSSTLLVGDIYSPWWSGTQHLLVSTCLSMTCFLLLF